MPIKKTSHLTPLAAVALWVALAISGCSSNSRDISSNNEDIAQNQSAEAQADDYQVEDEQDTQDVSNEPSEIVEQADNEAMPASADYQVITSANAYKATGKASFYSAALQGNKTASGERYDKYALTAAHKTLPLASFAKVTNLTNNKSVIVKINDRGPFHRSRLIDVSYAAADELGMVRSGTAKVKVEAVKLDANAKMALANYKSSAKSNRQSKSQAQGKGHYIQISSSKNRQRLFELGEQLASKKGYEYRLKTAGTWHQLQLGPIDNTKQAKKLLKKMKQQGYPDSYLIQ
ncbi:septal ring lytic transglycosylase RlpA family protein [Shewanella sp. SNU WT4]|uniref:septal ring lytic transglycosylase RlpA family protein n=1 Tax=Shewanella sp. SNU WT4 TaxID=2590015 RepID=UPI001125E547|nr:septal ring lytic transglycosylase RlpA family protein [Shewanella sp. SNU WT4]QDF67939.1 septal ring lytic transglycosylase RlpA family protein [Shewanella sp. SNU WT4]